MATGRQKPCQLDRLEVDLSIHSQPAYSMDHSAQENRKEPNEGLREGHHLVGLAVHVEPAPGCLLAFQVFDILMGRAPPHGDSLSWFL